MTWQQETIAESAREVSDLGRELYKRLATMGAHVSKLGRSLDGAVEAYNETVGSLERQVLVQARRFERHGITGIEPPELQPIERQTRPLAAAELVEPDQQPSSRPSPAGRRRVMSREHRPSSMRSTGCTPRRSGYALSEETP